MSDPRVTDKVVGVAFAAFTSDKFAHPVQAMRSALEAAAPLLAPPAVDREALSEALLAKWLYLAETKQAASPVDHCRALADAVLALLDGSAK